MKKSQTTSKSSAKTAKPSAKKTTGLSMNTAKKSLKKPSQSANKKKKEVGAKPPASLQKVPAKVKPAPVSQTKASVKKSVTAKATKPAEKTGSKKTLKSVKETSTKLSRPKATTKPAAKTSVPKAGKLTKAPAIKKTLTSKLSVKKPLKSLEKPAKVRKTPGKATAKTVSTAKSLARGKKPAKKPSAKTVAAATKLTQKTTVKDKGTKKSSVEKAKKVEVTKSVEKTVKSVKVAAGAKGVVKTKKTIAEKLKPAAKVKPLIAKTVPHIKAPAKQKGPLKPMEKEVPSLAARRKTVRQKVTPSLATAEPLPETSKRAPAYAAASVSSSIVTARAETKQKKASQLKVFLPDEELPPEETQVTPSPKLPEEYGENELLLMEVDPAIVFVSWEIKPDCISCKTGKLTLRVYDVTGLDFDGSNANMFFDIALSKRVDSKFIDIKMPGRDVIMEIGLQQPDGSFEPIKRSNRVSMPSLRTFEEIGIAGSLSAPDTLIGY